MSGSLRQLEMSNAPIAPAKTGVPMAVKFGLGVLAFAILSALIVGRPVRTLQDFDQPFYFTIAYDMDRYGVFSNGNLSQVDSTVTRPPAGMFFGPVYPALVYAAMQLDPRFAEAVRCSVEADRGHRDQASCESDELPMRLFNCFALAVGTVAVASAAELIFSAMFSGVAIFIAAGLLALAALAGEAEIFSYMMTEATIFCLYSMFAATSVRAWQSGRPRDYGVAGALLALLSLTKPSFLVQFPLLLGLSALWLSRRAASARWPRQAAKPLLVFTLAFAAPIGGWIARNAVSVGKIGFTEEYGTATLIERFAYNDMTPREFFQAFPYCVPGVGALVFDHVNGTDSMHRFVYFTPGSFFNAGRDRRNALLERYGSLDPLLPRIVSDEMRTRWWRHLLVSIPLTWCGMWTGGIVSLFLVPLFGCACWRALRTQQPLFLLYAAPALLNLVLVGLIGNHYTRYNLVLIGPYAVGAGALIMRWLQDAHWRWRARGSRSSTAPSASAVSDGGSTSPRG